MQRTTCNRSLPLIVAILLLASVSLAQEDSVITLTVGRAPLVGPPPVTESFIVSQSGPFGAPAPTAVLILLPGGTGNIGLTPVVPGGTLDLNESANFLVRVRWLLASQSFVVIILDAASLTMPALSTTFFHTTASTQR